MTTSASLLERHSGAVELAIRNRAGVRSYVIGAAVSLNAAFAGTTTLLTIGQGQSFRSISLQRSRRNVVEESRRGLTRISYDPVDFASATVPGDPDISFIRVAEIDIAGVTLPEGPILVVPPPGFYGSGRSSLLLNGTAPNVAGLANNLPPLTAMRIDLPRFADEITVFNDDGATSLFVSLGPGSQEMEVPFGTNITFPEAGSTEILIRGEGGTVAFRIIAAIVNGIQG